MQIAPFHPLFAKVWLHSLRAHARREKGRGRTRNAYTSSTVYCVHAQAALPHAHSDNSSWGIFSHEAHLTEQESRPPARRHCMTQANAIARVRTHP
jgi:hypothetical protein